jgi:hypothetical protein
MKIKESNEMMSYLTRPNRVFSSKPKQETAKTEKEVMKDPNLLRRIKYAIETYDDIKLGKDFDKAIAQEDKNLATVNGKTILQRYPKETTRIEKPFKQPKKTLKPELSARDIIEDIKINMPEVVEPIVKSQEEIEAEKRFNDMMQKAEEEKQRIRNGGLAYLMGEAKK